VRTVILVVLLCLAVLTAPLGWYLASRSLQPAPKKPIETVDPAEFEALRKSVDELTERVDELEVKLSRADIRRPDTSYADEEAPKEDAMAGNYAKVVQIADRRGVNEGLTHASASFLEELLGLPREDLTDECQPMTNETLKNLLVAEDVGPIKVNMLRPAVESLRQVFRNVQIEEPELYARIQGSGSLCVRRIRGAESAASAHAYGLAVDINIDGHLDQLGDGRTQLGLILMADYFNREGWYWGAGFGREDSMHFEVSREKLQQWRRLGKI